MSPVTRPKLSNPPQSIARRPWSDAAHALLIGGIAALVLIGAARRLGGDSAKLMSNLLVDDAFYYAVPARHVIEGKPFGFDGERPANGVQPLWAAVVVGLAALVRDDLLLARCMAGASALCWFLAAVVLFRALRTCGRWLALLAAVGWALAAFGDRIAFQGMENGLHALLAALLLRFGMRHLRSVDECRSSASFYLGLGLLLSLFTLCRVDSGLLGLLIGAGVLLGWIHHSGQARLKVNVGGAFLLALPAVILVGGYALLSRIYFGSAVPISGVVKLYYERQWGSPFASQIHSILWHVDYVFQLATEIPAHRLAARTILLTLVGLAGVAGLWRVARNYRMSLRSLTSGHVFILMLVVFTFGHLGAYAIALPHFAPYGTWYFAPEIMAIWIIIALGVHRVGGLFFRPSGSNTVSKLSGFSCATAVLLLAVGGIRHLTVRPVRDDPRTQLFLMGAQWADRHLPADEKLGAFSAGLLGYCAWNHQVINLDGLMNDLDYFTNYICAGRFPQYARDRNIRYLCDQAPLSAWRTGSFWGFALADLRLVRWWRMSGDLAYCIWELPGPASGGENQLSGLAVDGLSQLQYDAEVAQRYAVLTDAQLQAALRSGELGTRRVLTSIPTWPRFELRHVVASAAEADALHFDPAQLDIPNRCNVSFGGQVELLGYDLPVRTVPRGSRLLLTRFWRKLDSKVPLSDAVLVTSLTARGAGDEASSEPATRVIHATSGCHDTYPVAGWRAGQIVVETYAFDVSRSSCPGAYELSIALRDSQGEYVPPATSGDPGRTTLFIANVRIVR
jgi:hypothetical protein